MLKTTPAEDQAGLAFIKFLASPAEGAYLTSQSGGLPSSPAQIGQPVLKQAESAKWYSVFANNLKYGQLRPLNPQWYTASSSLYTQISNAAIRREGHARPSAVHGRTPGRSGARPERLVLPLGTFARSSALRPMRPNFAVPCQPGEGCPSSQ